MINYRLFACFCLSLSGAFAAVPRPLDSAESEARQKMMSKSAIPETFLLNAGHLREKFLIPFSQEKSLDSSREDVLRHHQEKVNKTDDEMKAFFTLGGIEMMPVVAKTESAASLDSEKKEISPSDKKNEEMEMVITSDDGLYFDSEAGLLVYLKNVKLVDPRFTLDCDNQLKIYLDEDPAKGKKPAEEKIEEKSTLKTPDFGSMNFSGIKYISATGNVKITRTDEKGQLMKAEAEEVTYDGKTGEIVLSGGEKQMLEDGKNRITATGDGSYIRIFGNGSVYVKGKRLVTKIVNDEKTDNPFKSKK